MGALLPLAVANGQSVPSTNNLPVLGDTARADLSPVLERKIGEEIMHDIRRNKDYLDDAPILEYLNNFGATLLSAVPGGRGETNADFVFFAVRDPMLNAFAMPGGFIGVHSGLVIAAQTESELASVMSHEIGHVTQRHIARQIGKQSENALIPLAAMVLAGLAAKSSTDAAMGVLMGGQGLAIQRQLDFSREAEREADRVGFQIMGNAGFDTTGMVAFFGRMQTASRMYSDAMPAYLRTHPLTTERISDIQARIREAPKSERADSMDFHLVRARLRVLQDETSGGMGATEIAFKDQLATEGRAQQASAQYGLAVLALRRGQLALAQEWLDKARATLRPKSQRGVFSASAPVVGDGEAILTSLALEIKLAPRQTRELMLQGLQEAEQAHARYPLSRGIARQYADAMIANGKLDDAVRFLREQVQQYREEAKLHELLAKTYAAQGKQALQHLSLAESYALSGGVMGALDQLALARKAKDASFYDLAIIDARERELQARRREALKERGEDDDERR
ncbi:MAG TPA: M48 family metalloprotease [Telluria sp.]